MKKIKNFKCTVLFLTLLLTAVPWNVPLIAADGTGTGSSVSMKGIEETVEELMQEGDIPGLSLVIARGDEPVIVKSFGYADREAQIPVTPRTLFQLGSTSKAFTGLAALKCEADGLLNPDAPVSKYLPWFYTVYKGIL